MRDRFQGFLAVVFLFAISCGGSAPQEKSPSQRQSRAEESLDDIEQTSAPAAGRKRHEESSDEAGKPPPEPEFKEGMSVTDAINAVPPGTPRTNIDQEALGEPLKDQKTWASCKLAPGDHFKIVVAVWDGHAVGIDVDSKNKRVADCIAQAAHGVTWRDKVRSLNTVEYAQ